MKFLLDLFRLLTVNVKTVEFRFERQNEYGIIFVPFLFRNCCTILDANENYASVCTSKYLIISLRIHN